jgi:hypothetical protein
LYGIFLPIYLKNAQTYIVRTTTFENPTLIPTPIRTTVSSFKPSLKSNVIPTRPRSTCPTSKSTTTPTSNPTITRTVNNNLISTYAGNGVKGYSGDNGYAVNAQLSNPYALTTDTNSDLYIADTSNKQINKHYYNDSRNWQ